MKFLLIIVILVTVVYGFNPERNEKFKRDYIECNRRYGHKKLTFCMESFKCALYDDDQVFQEYDKFSASKFLEFMKDVISDESELQQAQQLFESSYKQISQAGSRQPRYIPAVVNRLSDLVLRILSLILLF